MLTTERFVIYAPKEARTKDSIFILWDKVNEGSEKLKYDVYVNEELFSTVDCTDITLTELNPDSEYSVQIKVNDGRYVIATEKICVKTKKEGSIYNILDFGAKSDEVNTDAIQKAIDSCAEGGIVYVPEGTYYSGALFLHSDMTLELAKGAKLVGTGKKEDFEPFYYPYEGRWEKCYASLLNVRTKSQYAHEDTPQYSFDEYKNISIVGEGIIDGNGEALFRDELENRAGISRGRTVCIRNTTGLYIYGVTVRNSPAWCLHMIYCKNVTVNKVSLYNKFDEDGKLYSHFNGDGIDPDSCQDVFICHSYIQSQDDSIALKSGREPLGLKLAQPTKNVRISNCILSYGFGVVVGSEMSGSVKNVLVQDIDMEETYCAVNIKTRHNRGGEISDITYENIKMRLNAIVHEDTKWFRGAICIDQFYGDDKADYETKKPVDNGTSTIRNITVKNVDMELTNRYGIYLCGLPENHPENIELENISIKGSEGCFLKNIDNMKMSKVKTKSSFAG